MSIKVKVERELSDEFVGDVLVTAFDGNFGGCWETWAEPDTHEASGREGGWLRTDDNDNWTTCYILVSDPEGLSTTEANLVRGGVKVDANAIRVGIQKIIDGGVVGRHVQEMVVAGVLEGDAGEIDSLAADCIVQAGVFGKIIWS